MHVRQPPHIVDRSTGYQLRSPVLRSTIGINDYGSFAGKALENAGLYGLDDGLNGLGIVMGRQAYQDVDLAYVNELAKKIIGQEGLFRQFNLRAKLSSCAPVQPDCQYPVRSDPSQPEPVKLVRAHG